MKLFERHEAEKQHERLPDMPPGVEVPDDISGIEPPATPRPTTGGVRWMRWLAAIVLLAGAGVVAALVLTSGSDGDETPAQTPVDLMQSVGTDNPEFVPGAPGPRSVEIAPAVDFMELYGTDNPTFVVGADGPNTAPDPGEWMSLYGTDNPEFVETPPMQQFGTDNPAHLP